MNKREEKSGSIIEMAKKITLRIITTKTFPWMMYPERSISARIISASFSKETTGENFIEYLTNLRMDKAKELLETTECSMKGDLRQNGIFRSELFQPQL